MGAPSNKITLLSEIRNALAAVYESRLEGLVLYGSVARGDGGDDSDIDVLVLLEGPIAYGVELGTIVDALYPLSLKWGRPISGKPALPSDFDEALYPLYQSAKRDGIRL